jgi:Bacterial type III secretion protein (HrpB1_HrpK)
MDHAKTVLTNIDRTTALASAVNICRLMVMTCGYTSSRTESNLMNTQAYLDDITVDLTGRFELAIREQRLDDAHRLLQELAEHDAEVAAQPVFSTALALAKGDAIGALQALQAGSTEVEGLRAICLYILEDPTWQGIAELIVENSDDPVARNAMLSLLGRESGVT